jgi:hypothetical protein
MTASNASSASSTVWTTYYGDARRTGLATDGPSPASSVREQWTSSKLDGDVYTQPLLVGSRVVIATEHDTVYPLNATDGAIVWQRHLGEPVAGSSLPCDNIDPVGITGTPVVDVPTNRIYVVAMVQSGQHMLFELDATTGRVIASTRVDANGVDPAVHNQRGALTLSNGTIFVPDGGRYGDCGDYHGGLVAVTVSVSGLGTVASYTLPTQRAASRGYSARPVRTFVRTLGTKRAPTRGRVCVFAGETWCRRGCVSSGDSGRLSRDMVDTEAEVSCGARSVRGPGCARRKAQRSTRE